MLFDSIFPVALIVAFLIEIVPALISKPVKPSKLPPFTVSSAVDGKKTAAESLDLKIPSLIVIIVSLYNPFPEIAEDFAVISALSMISVALVITSIP